MDLVNNDENSKFFNVLEILKNIQTLLGHSNSFYGSIIDKIQVSLKCWNDLSKTFIVATNLQHPHYSFHPRLPRQINCMNLYCDIIEPSYLVGQTVHLLDIILMKHMYSKKVLQLCIRE